MRATELLILSAGLASCAAQPRGTEPNASKKNVGSLVVHDVNGGALSLGELRGQVVLLDFWATWCEPCKRSLPVYDRWNRELGEKGLVVVAVSVDESDEGVAEFLAEHAASLTPYRDRDGELAQTFDLPTMPTAFLIDMDGIVVSQHVGFVAEDEAALKAEVVALLGAP